MKFTAILSSLFSLGLLLGTANAETLYFHNDHLGTPQALTDKDQNVLWEAEYIPFGEATVTTEGVEMNLRLPGQYFDVETGLHYNYFRDYDPSIGRYIQSDPLGVYGGLSTYNYANASPMMYVDPTGEIAFIPILVGIAAGVVFDYALESYKESRECSCEGSMASTAGNAALGASFGFFGAFDKKPRTGVAGGGRSGDRTSIFSQINHASARKGIYSNRTRHALTAVGRSAPYAGAAIAAYQIYNAATCE